MTVRIAPEILIKCLNNYVLLLLLLLIPILVNASALPEWEIVPADSTLTFTATQNNAPVSGQFKKFTGKIFFDPNNYKDSSTYIIIDMNSLSASYADLTTTLVSADWFDVALFPKAEFRAVQFNKTGEKTYQANGTLTIRNKSVPVTLTFTAEISKNKALVEGSTRLKRSNFGVGQGEWSSTNEIKDEVTVNFKVVATRKNKV